MQQKWQYKILVFKALPMAYNNNTPKNLPSGLRESVKKLDKREAMLCVLAESTDEKNILKLVEALCREHGINLIKVSRLLCFSQQLKAIVCCFTRK